MPFKMKLWERVRYYCPICDDNVITTELVPRDRKALLSEQQKPPPPKISYLSDGTKFTNYVTFPTYIPGTLIEDPLSKKCPRRKCQIHAEEYFICEYCNEKFTDKNHLYREAKVSGIMDNYMVSPDEEFTVFCCNECSDKFDNKCCKICNQSMDEEKFKTRATASLYTLMCEDCMEKKFDCFGCGKTLPRANMSFYKKTGKKIAYCSDCIPYHLKLDEKLDYFYGIYKGEEDSIDYVFICLRCDKEYYDPRDTRTRDSEYLPNSNFERLCNRCELKSSVKRFFGI
jgi:hypothetical protein